MKLVMFGNGTYGVRRGWIWHEYKDLSPTNSENFTFNSYWCSRDSIYFLDCQSPSRERAEEYISMYTINDRVI